MKPEQMYQSLKELAEKLGIQVSEKSFRNTGIQVKSGHCIIRDQNAFIMNKHMPVQRKARTLATFLSTKSYDDVYVLPAVRNFIETFSSSKKNTSVT